MGCAFSMALVRTSKRMARIYFVAFLRFPPISGKPFQFLFPNGAPTSSPLWGRHPPSRTETTRAELLPLACTVTYFTNISWPRLSHCWQTRCLFEPRRSTNVHPLTSDRPTHACAGSITPSFSLSLDTRNPWAVSRSLCARIPHIRQRANRRGGFPASFLRSVRRRTSRSTRGIWPFSFRRYAFENT